MKRTAAVLVLLIGLGVAPTPARGGVAPTPERGRFNFISGHDLARNCAENESGYTGGFCTGYIVGAFDADVHLCVPDDVKVAQIEAVVTKYLRDHPEKLHYTADSLVEEAIHAAFPCKQ